MASGYYQTMTATPVRRLIWTGGTVAVALFSFLIYQLVYDASDAFVAFIASVIPGFMWVATVPLLHRRWSALDEGTD